MFWLVDNVIVDYRRIKLIDIILEVGVATKIDE